MLGLGVVSALNTGRLERLLSLEYLKELVEVEEAFIINELPQV